jgi:beta-aspartyl-peptidase (threonine type)
VGDSALIGSGTYADNTTGGVSCTGSGEAIIRVVLARRALDYLHDVDDPTDAAKRAVELLVAKGRGQGGLIVLDRHGRPGYAQSTPLMPVGWMSTVVAEPVLPF